MAKVISVGGKYLKERYQKQQPNKSEVEFTISDGNAPPKKPSVKKMKGIGPAAILKISDNALKAYEEKKKSQQDHARDSNNSLYDGNPSTN